MVTMTAVTRMEAQLDAFEFFTVDWICWERGEKDFCLKLQEIDIVDVEGGDWISYLKGRV